MTAYRADPPNPNRHKRVRFEIDLDQNGPGLSRYFIRDKFSGRIIKDNFINRERAWEFLVRVLDGEISP
ncbi:MAG: hypothetical protein WA728_23185 [Xanthobacteraceae bacterium]